MSDHAAAIAARTRAAQGLPPKVEDPAALAKVATLLTSSQEARHAA